MLIDTENDPGEMVNLAGHSKYKEERDTLKEYLLNHLAKNDIIVNYKDEETKNY